MCSGGVFFDFDINPIMFFGQKILIKIILFEFSFQKLQIFSMSEYLFPNSELLDFQKKNHLKKIFFHCQ